MASVRRFVRNRENLLFLLYVFGICASGLWVLDGTVLSPALRPLLRSGFLNGLVRVAFTSLGSLPAVWLAVWLLPEGPTHSALGRALLWEISDVLEPLRLLHRNLIEDTGPNPKSIAQHAAFAAECVNDFQHGFLNAELEDRYAPDQTLLDIAKSVRGLVELFQLHVYDPLNEPPPDDIVAEALRNQAAAVLMNRIIVILEEHSENTVEHCS